MTVPRPRYILLAVLCGLLAGIGIAGVLTHLGSGFPSDRSRSGEAGRATFTAPSGEPGAAMSPHETPRPLPNFVFKDGDGRALTLADFRGKMVLLNIWATWCGPCRREMPTLDRLQAKLGGPHFEVVALSIDRAGIGVVAEFYAEVGVEHLAKYIDASGKAARQLNALGLPTTLLIDQNGREISRHVGPAEWDTPEMIAFFRRYLSRESGAFRPGANG